MTFSRDGRSIAYASDRAGNFDIWMQSLDGGGSRQLTKSPAQESQPDWSPDGKSIAFHSERNGGGLFVVATEGGAERQLTSFGKYPLWSADGSQILFRAGLDDRIYTVSPNGGEAPRELVQDFLRGGAWHWIAPHPDGRVSAMGQHPRTGHGFYTVSRDGKQVVSSSLAKDLPLRWTLAQTRHMRFQWNAKGTALYLEAILNEVQNVWRVRVNPTTLEWVSAERLTTGSGPDAAAALSHDGTRIAFSAQRQSTRLWAFPFDSRSGQITGKGSAVTPEDADAECRKPLARWPLRGLFEPTSRQESHRTADHRH